MKVSLCMAFSQDGRLVGWGVNGWVDGRCGGVEVVVHGVLLCWCCAGTWLWRVWMWSVYGVWRVGRSSTPLCLKVCWQPCSPSCVVRV